MKIGGKDFWVNGKVSEEAPDFVRRNLVLAWPDGVVEDANLEGSPLVPLVLRDRTLWKIPSELLVYRTLETRDGIDYPYRGMIHVLFSEEGVTLVAGEDEPGNAGHPGSTLSMAANIEAALRVNRMVG